MTWKYDSKNHEIDSYLACTWEVSARKLGNVHRYRDFEDTTYLDFVFSASATAAVLRIAPSRPIGESIYKATHLTRCTVGSNTNIGIILLLTPLASISVPVPLPRHIDYAQMVELGRNELKERLTKLTIRDTKDVYSAIRLAAPGGLGDAPEQDVRGEPTVTLLEAMKLAADRDMIARQYANGFADVFDFGTPGFLVAFERFECIEAAVIDCQLRWLAAFPDSLIARKNGLPVAEGVRSRAAEVLARGGLETPEGRAAGVALDQYLRSDGNRLNPGTTADLVTACLFVALRENKVNPSAPFRWRVEDWL